MDGMNITISTPEVKRALQEMRPHLSQVADCRLTYDDVIGIPFPV